MDDESPGQSDDTARDVGAALPERTRTLLRAAAVLGSPFDATELAALTGQTAIAVETGLEPAVRRGIIIEDGIGLAFRDDDVRVASYESISPSVRRALHAEAADHLERLGAAPRRIVNHIRQAASVADDVALTRLTRAARRLADEAPGIASEILETAREIGGPSLGRFTLEAELATLWAETGRFDDAAALSRRLLAEHRGGEQDHALLIALAEAELRTGRPEECLALVRSAAARGKMAAASQSRFLSIGAEAAALADPVSAESMAGEAIALATNAGDATALCSAHLAMAQALSGRALSEATRHGRQAAELARDGRVGAALAVRALATLGDALGNPPETRAESFSYLHAAARRAGDAGLTRAEPALHATLARNHFRDGALDDALSALDAADADSSADDGGSADDDGRRDRLALRAYLSALTGDTPTAAALMQMDLRPSPGTIAALSMALARTLLLEVDAPADALALLVADVEATRHIRPAAVVSLATPLARLALVCGTPRALDSTCAVLEQAASGAHEWVRAIAMLSAGAAAGDLAQTEAGLVDITSVSAVATTVAEAHEVAALLFHRWGRSEDAARCWRGAWTRWTTMRARAPVARVGTRLGEGAILSPAAPAEGWEALTETEWRVVALVIERLYYREIGETLGVSRRTVESHVASVFRKLDISSRRELEQRYAAHEGP